MLVLKKYQERCLKALRDFFARARDVGVPVAFQEQTERPYIEVSGTGSLAGMPYVCVRIPTGGGKTLVACHAIRIAIEELLNQPRALVLWLAPTQTIRDQTITRLRTPGDPYRDALTSDVGDNVVVLDLDEAFGLTRANLSGATCVIVATIQALRVDDTEGRRIYSDAGALAHHFSGLPARVVSHLQHHPDNGVIPSLANVIALHRPIVIIDEAHNARTTLSFEVLARLAPSAIMELTATPETVHNPAEGRFASNVLYHVSAADLRDESMIKLPVSLRMYVDWADAVRDAMTTRLSLEEKAMRLEKRALRPIILYQAQPRSGTRETITAQDLCDRLVRDFGVPREEIAIEMGSTRELEGVDLYSPTCPIRHIVTVQALREGWDCPWAYVLCSITTSHSARSVEQLLGRVLRQPNAERFDDGALNRAYAVTASASFADTATSLREALVESGFERFEANQYIETDFVGAEPLLQAAYAEVSEPPRTAHLPAELKQRITFDAESGYLYVTGGALNGEDEALLVSAFSSESAKRAVKRVSEALRSTEHTETDANGQPAAPPTIPARTVPWLSIDEDGQLEVFAREHFASEFSLAECKAELTTTEYSRREATAVEITFDVASSGRIVQSFASTVQEQLDLIAPSIVWTVEALAGWIDRQLQLIHIAPMQSTMFCELAIDLLCKQGYTLDELAKDRKRLATAVGNKIDQYYKAYCGDAWQRSLFSTDALQVEANPLNALVLDPARYTYSEPYTGGWQFKKHLFRTIGDLKATGEEFECAVQLDEHSSVDKWVRNTAKRSCSFWLQTPTDKFYPDFIAFLTNGKTAVVEYKNTTDVSNDENQMKKKLGELWARKSGDQCHFVMHAGTNWNPLKSALSTWGK